MPSAGDPITPRPETLASARAAGGSRSRFAWFDNLKVLLIAGVVVGHVTIAWTGIGVWVFKEPPVREPLLSFLTLVAALGALFAMPLFFLIAGVFTPVSFERKGLGRFLADRAIRLGAPMLFYILLLSPIIEYVDPDNAGWDRGFGRFILYIWWPPAPGPTWFLGVLLVYSVGYALVRTARPSRATRVPPRAWQLATAGAAIALISYGVRFAVPLGEERWRLAIGQAPAWTIGFIIGALGAERGWFTPVDPGVVRRVRQTALVALGAVVALFLTCAVMDIEFEQLAGDGTWLSALTAVLEGALVVSLSLWLLDLFRRRADHQGRLLRAMSRSAYAAFVLHQLVLVELVLAIRHLPWPPEVEYLTVASLGVAGSFALGWLVLRLPGVSRVV